MYIGVGELNAKNKKQKHPKIKLKTTTTKNKKVCLLQHGYLEVQSFNLRKLSVRILRLEE